MLLPRLVPKLWKQLTFLVSVAAILDLLNLRINRWKYSRANPLDRFKMCFTSKKVVFQP